LLNIIIDSNITEHEYKHKIKLIFLNGIKKVEIK